MPSKRSIPLTCPTCSKIFFLLPSRVAQGRKYCSLACHYTPRAQVTCEQCGVAFNVKAGRAGTARFCSTACRNLKSPGKFVHGESKSPEFSSWASIKGRCLNPNYADFHTYGGRGITICDEWRDNFAAFLDHVGRRPSPRHTIDRIDVNRGYEPGNVRWATPKEQAANRRNNVFLTLDGVTRSLAEWAEAIGISVITIRSRLDRAWSVEQTLTAPKFRGRAMPDRNRGARNPKAKFTVDQVRLIRQRVANGERQVDLAREYGVSQTNISGIVRHLLWTDVE